MLIRDLTLDALLVLTVFRADHSVLGGTSLRLFDELNCLKMGKQKLLFYFGRRFSIFYTASLLIKTVH